MNSRNEVSFSKGRPGSYISISLMELEHKYISGIAYLLGTPDFKHNLILHDFK